VASATTREDQGVRGRDIVLGAAALHPDSTVRRATLCAGIAMDLIDTAVVADAARRGLPRKAAVVGMALAGGTAAFAAVGPTLVGALRKQ
jgi:acetyl-CoA acetyltransferase